MAADPIKTLVGMDRKIREAGSPRLWGDVGRADSVFYREGGGTSLRYVHSERLKRTAAFEDDQH